MLAWFLLIPALGPVAAPARDQRAWIGWLTLLLILQGTAMAVWLPKSAAQRLREGGQEDRVAVLSWACASLPVFFGFCCVVLGGPQWPLALGFVASVGLLVKVSRTEARRK